MHGDDARKHEGESTQSRKGETEAEVEGGYGASAQGAVACRPLRGRDRRRRSDCARLRRAKGRGAPCVAGGGAKCACLVPSAPDIPRGAVCLWRDQVFCGSDYAFERRDGCSASDIPRGGACERERIRGFKRLRRRDAERLMMVVAFLSGQVR